MTTPRQLEIAIGMRLERRPGSFVLTYQDERIPIGERLVVTYISKVGNTVTLWLETQARSETLLLRDVVTPDFVVVDEQVSDLSDYTMMAATTRHGNRITAFPGLRVQRTGRPFGTTDIRVPYGKVVTVTEVEYEEQEPGLPTKDFVNFVTADGRPAYCHGYEMTDAYFEIVALPRHPGLRAARHLHGR